MSINPIVLALINKLSTSFENNTAATETTNDASIFDSDQTLNLDDANLETLRTALGIGLILSLSKGQSSSNQQQTNNSNVSNPLQFSGIFGNSSNLTNLLNANISPYSSQSAGTSVFSNTDNSLTNMFNTYSAALNSGSASTGISGVNSSGLSSLNMNSYSSLSDNSGWNQMVTGTQSRINNILNFTIPEPTKENNDALIKQMKSEYEKANNVTLTDEEYANIKTENKLTSTILGLLANQ